MKKQYTKPEAELFVFDYMDVAAASPLKSLRLMPTTTGEETPEVSESGAEGESPVEQLTEPDIAHEAAAASVDVMVPEVFAAPDPEPEPYFEPEPAVSVDSFDPAPSDGGE